MRFVTSPRLIITVFGMAAAIALGCGGGSDGGMTGSQNANVTGTWDVTIAVTGGTQAPPGSQFTAVFTLAQSGSTVTGTFSTAGGLSGQISGSVSGQAFAFAILQGTPCLGSFSGTATVSGSGTQISGSYFGSDCNGTLQVSAVATNRND
jgi:hypothetical protein